MPGKAYVTIHFESHDYTATVSRPGALENFLSRKSESFRLGAISGHPESIPGFVSELNRISRFGHCLNRSATAR